MTHHVVKEDHVAARSEVEGEDVAAFGLADAGLSPEQPSQRLAASIKDSSPSDCIMTSGSGLCPTLFRTTCAPYGSSLSRALGSVRLMNLFASHLTHAGVARHVADRWRLGSTSLPARCPEPSSPTKAGTRTHCVSANDGITRRTRPSVRRDLEGHRLLRDHARRRLHVPADRLLVHRDRLAVGSQLQLG